MNKQEIIDRLFDKLRTGGCRYPKWELNSIIDPFLEVIKETLAEGQEIRLPNFGKFAIKVQRGRKYYNIQTGKMGFTPDKRVIAFIQHKSFNTMSQNK